MTPRVDDLGRLLYPTRGKPPAVPSPDYTRDPGNPFIMLPILPECKFRVEMEIGCGDCKRTYMSHVCEKEFPIGLSECKNCIESGRRDKL